MNSSTLMKFHSLQPQQHKQNQTIILHYIPYLTFIFKKDFIKILFYTNMSTQVLVFIIEVYNVFIYIITFQFMYCKLIRITEVSLSENTKHKSVKDWRFENLHSVSFNQTWRRGSEMMSAVSSLLLECPPAHK